MIGQEQRAAVEATLGYYGQLDAACTEVGNITAEVVLDYATVFNMYDTASSELTKEAIPSIRRTELDATAAFRRAALSMQAQLTDEAGVSSGIDLRTLQLGTTYDNVSQGLGAVKKALDTTTEKVNGAKELHQNIGVKLGNATKRAIESEDVARAATQALAPLGPLGTHPQGARVAQSANETHAYAARVRGFLNGSEGIKTRCDEDLQHDEADNKLQAARRVLGVAVDTLAELRKLTNENSIEGFARELPELTGSLSNVASSLGALAIGLESAGVRASREGGHIPRELPAILQAAVAHKDTTVQLLHGLLAS